MSRVLIIADTHAPCMLERYPYWLKTIYEQWSCDRVVHIGDLVDWASISYHPKAPSLKNSEVEFEQAMDQVQALYKLFPRVDWLIGNHDALSERQALDCGLPTLVLKDYAKLWKVDKWTVHPRFADLMIDGIIYRHGDKGRGGAMPAFSNAQSEFAKGLVQGHWHASAGVMYGANKNRRYFGLQVGCGINISKSAMDYGKKFSKRPVLGCGIVIDGKFPLFEPMEL